MTDTEGSSGGAGAQATDKTDQAIKFLGNVNRKYTAPAASKNARYYTGQVIEN